VLRYSTRCLLACTALLAASLAWLTYRTETAIVFTGRNDDILVVGSGRLICEGPSGTIKLCRACRLVRGKSGQLAAQCDEDILYLQPSIFATEDAADVEVQVDGIVRQRVSGGDWNDIGQLDVGICRELGGLKTFGVIDPPDGSVQRTQPGEKSLTFVLTGWTVREATLLRTIFDNAPSLAALCGVLLVICRMFWCQPSLSVSQSLS
jgi:hypothetical protein